MQELRHETEQTIVVGLFLEKKSRGYPINPYSGMSLDWCWWRYLIKSNGTVVDISSRAWEDVPNCDGMYFLTLLSSDVNRKGFLTVYIHDASFLGKPVVQYFQVVDKNVYDSKYGDELLKVSPEPGIT